MADLRIGEPDVKPDDPSHVKGVKSGNSVGNYESQDGHLKDGRGTADRATGINPDKRNPIDPRMPNLMPG